MSSKLILILIALTFIDCSETIVENDSDRLGWQYFPAELGAYRIYSVNEIRYSLVGAEESTYELRESIVDSVSNNEIIDLIIHRETRVNENEEWELDSVWTAKIDPYRAILIENNIALVKLSFPLINENIWDGNAFNSRSEDIYRYELSLADTTLNNHLYTDLWTVVQSDLGEDFLGRNDRSEVYAAHVGMIIKEEIVWEYCQTDCSEDKQIVNGRELYQSLISYGNLIDENE
ncbi:MAG: hypothetical protein JXR07_10025 [Reichenbachiella sp.]